jgi:nitrite reductase (NADH) small subunit
MTAWTAVCRVEEIPVLGARRVNRERGLPVALFRTADERIHALLDRCPHRGGPLSQGIVFGSSVACPLHNWTIGLGDGCARAPDAGCTPRFAVRLSGDAVQLDLQELRTLALAATPAQGLPAACGKSPGAAATSTALSAPTAA